MTENHGGPWVPITGETTPGGTRMMGPGQRPEGIGAGAEKKRKEGPTFLAQGRAGWNGCEDHSSREGLLAINFPAVPEMAVPAWGAGPPLPCCRTSWMSGCPTLLSWTVCPQGSVTQCPEHTVRVRLSSPSWEGPFYNLGFSEKGTKLLSHGSLSKRETFMFLLQ